MMLEKIEEGKIYDIEWVDGEVVNKCIFTKKHRNFLIFVDNSGSKIVCRPESIRTVQESR
jgi:hypothetical protein